MIILCRHQRLNLASNLSNRRIFPSTRSSNQNQQSDAKQRRRSRLRRGHDAPEQPVIFHHPLSRYPRGEEQVALATPLPPFPTVRSHSPRLIRGIPFAPRIDPQKSILRRAASGFSILTGECYLRLSALSALRRPKCWPFHRPSAEPTSCRSRNLPVPFPAS